MTLFTVLVLLLSFMHESLMWRGRLPTFYYSVADVHHVDAQDPYAVIVHEDTLGIWTLRDIGGLPMHACIKKKCFTLQANIYRYIIVHMSCSRKKIICIV